jgi:hypothetical protein
MIRFLLCLFNGFLLLLFILLGIAVQTSLLTSIAFSWLQLFFSIFGVIWVALERSLEEGGILVLLIGYITELNSTAPSGLISLSLMITYLVIRFFSRYFLIRSWVFFSLISAFGYVLYRVSGSLFLWILKSKTPDTLTFLRTVFYGAVSNALLAIWVFPLLEKLDAVTLSASHSD